MIFVRWLTKRVGEWHGRPVSGWHLQRDGEHRTVCGIPETWHPHYRVVCTPRVFGSAKAFCPACLKGAYQSVPQQRDRPHPGG